VTLAAAVTISAVSYWLLSLWMKSTQAEALPENFGNCSELKGLNK